jgi:hypothetical protein
VKDENGDLPADSHNILNRWKNYFFQLMNEHVSDVMQIEKQMTEPLVPGPSRLEVEIAIAKLEKYISQGSVEIPAELIQTGGEILLCTNYLYEAEHYLRGRHLCNHSIDSQHFMEHTDSLLRSQEFSLS